MERRAHPRLHRPRAHLQPGAGGDATGLPRHHPGRNQGLPAVAAHASRSMVPQPTLGPDMGLPGSGPMVSQRASPKQNSLFAEPLQPISKPNRSNLKASCFLWHPVRPRGGRDRAHPQCHCPGQYIIGYCWRIRHWLPFTYPKAPKSSLYASRCPPTGWLWVPLGTVREFANGIIIGTQLYGRDPAPKRHRPAPSRHGVYRPMDVRHGR